MGIGREAANRNAVGDELLAVLPIDGKPWYKRAHLVKLHFCVFSLMMFCRYTANTPRKSIC